MKERPLASHSSEAAPLEPSSVQQQAPGDRHSTKGYHAPANLDTSNDAKLGSAAASDPDFHWAANGHCWICADLCYTCTW